MSNSGSSLTSSIDTDFESLSRLAHEPLQLIYLRVCGDLAASNLELSEAMQDVERSWVTAYRNSMEGSISAREKDARVSVLEYATEVIRLRGEIFALKEKKSILEFLLNNASGNSSH